MESEEKNVMAKASVMKWLGMHVLRRKKCVRKRFLNQL